MPDYSGEEIAARYREAIREKLEAVAAAYTISQQNGLIDRIFRGKPAQEKPPTRFYEGIWMWGYSVLHPAQIADDGAFKGQATLITVILEFAGGRPAHFQLTIGGQTVTVEDKRFLTARDPRQYYRVGTRFPLAGDFEQDTVRIRETIDAALDANCIEAIIWQGEERGWGVRADNLHR